jgi:hypothetical protein
MPVYEEQMNNNVRTAGVLDTPIVVAGIVIGCVIALWLLRRGFRGVGIPGVGSVSLGR